MPFAGYSPHLRNPTGIHDEFNRVRQRPRDAWSLAFNVAEGFRGIRFMLPAPQHAGRPSSRMTRMDDKGFPVTCDIRRGGPSRSSDGNEMAPTCSEGAGIAPAHGDAPAGARRGALRPAGFPDLLGFI